MVADMKVDMVADMKVVFFFDPKHPVYSKKGT